MTNFIARIGFLLGLGIGLVSCASDTVSVSVAQLDLANMEERLGGRVGVALVNQSGDVVLAHRADERFAMCSTFKLPLAAAILQQHETGSLSLDDAIRFDDSDLLSYAPITRARVGQGQLSVQELASAIVVVSDNTAANLLLDRIGGPAGFTAFVRRMGDQVTQLDRTEPTLNENRIGDVRDTTSPASMGRLVAHLAVGDGLTHSSQVLLLRWASESETGLGRIRAGLPDGWRAGDKTGNCRNAHNDVAIILPPARGPFVLAVYIDRPSAEMGLVDEAIAEIGAIAAERIITD